MNIKQIYIYIYINEIIATALAMVSSVLVPKTKIDARVSTCIVGKHQEVQETPSNPILPPELSEGCQHEVEKTPTDPVLAPERNGAYQREGKETPLDPVLPPERNGSHEGELKETPSDPLLPPEPSGSYEVDESVKACGFGSYSGHDNLLIADLLSFPSPWNENPPHPQLRHVVMG